MPGAPAAGYLGGMPRFFNTTGVCLPEYHYMVPPLPRLPEARRYVAQGGYFVVHAPRQTGKTTTLRALARALTEEGEYAALHFSCETGQAAGDDESAAQRAVLGTMRLQARLDLPDETLRPPDPSPAADESVLLGNVLQEWALSCPRRLVLVFDEIDALRGDSLVAVLRQLRAGHPNRPRGFPWSVILCGLRDVRDYTAASGGDARRLGSASPFNIKVASPRLGDFSPDDVRALYSQHSEETGQAFREDALLRAFELTQGQPWLVSSLAKEAVEELGLEPDEPITAEHIDEAKERLVLARATHLDSLVARLTEPRVQRVIEPVLAGSVGCGDTYDDDFQYVRDLGLVAPDSPVRVANPIYREVIVRVLAAAAERHVTAEPRSFVQSDGHLDLRRLLEEFAAFWVRHGEVLAGHLPYHEVAPQLVLMAFLHRVVNAGGHVDREYGIGRGRIDLLVRWRVQATEGSRQPTQWQQEALELKVWRPGQGDPLDEGLAQLERYLERLGLDRGVLVVFDRREEALPIDERTLFEESTTPGHGWPVTLLRA